MVASLLLPIFGLELVGATLLPHEAMKMVMMIARTALKLTCVEAWLDPMTLGVLRESRFFAISAFMTSPVESPYCATPRRSTQAGGLAWVSYTPTGGVSLVGTWWWTGVGYRSLPLCEAVRPVDARGSQLMSASPATGVSHMFDRLVEGGDPLV